MPVGSVLFSKTVVEEALWPLLDLAIWLTEVPLVLVSRDVVTAWMALLLSVLVCVSCCSVVLKRSTLADVVVLPMVAILVEVISLLCVLVRLVVAVLVVAAAVAATAVVAGVVACAAVVSHVSGQGIGHPT